ncbi:Trk system potassium transporter TrkA [Halocalculus aciditolerans]|uniref:Trk system potassium transport protein TrkA n=1 Tax=Halocalculus aciditolerans TaxID=1383812 RepID=A0A830F112_9EURY|nr:Trk system potassium transporter TrkA [Halocalculus aciditolerans]GGL50795.1 Trk system potassium transport protein TrkA [Halocalculus aciditolerans]
MRVVIVGAGEVGSSIAADLSDAHDVVVIDVDSERVEALTYNVDVLPVEGDGTDPAVLEEASVDAADMVIASTDDDETNLAVCGTAATLGDPFTIARVQKTTYLQTWRRAQGAFSVDFMVCTDLLTAQSVVRVIGFPTATDVDPFAGGRVQMAEFEVPEDSPIAGQTVQEADRFESLTFAAVIRDGETHVPRGETVLTANSRVLVIGTPQSVEAFAAAITPERAVGNAEDVLIVGGSQQGFLIAKLLGERGFSPRLIERDEARARDLAERLPETTVMAHDATDAEFLEREHVGESDVVISCLDSDEKTLLASLLVKRLGAARSVAVVDSAEYVDLFETVGVDVAVNPREVTAEEITRFTRERRAENVAIIEPGTAEVLEIEVDGESVLAGRAIQDAVQDLPDGLVIGAITRGEAVITPRGDTVVEVGDHVVVFVREDARDTVEAKL